MKSWFKYLVNKFYYVIVVVLTLLFLNVAAGRLLDWLFKLTSNFLSGKYQALTVSVLLTLAFSIAFFVFVLRTAYKYRYAIQDLQLPDKKPSVTQSDRKCACVTPKMPIGMLSIDDDKIVMLSMDALGEQRMLTMTFTGTSPLRQCSCPVMYCPICGGKLM